MNPYDPTSPSANETVYPEYEWSLEDVSQTTASVAAVAPRPNASIRRLPLQPIMPIKPIMPVKPILLKNPVSGRYRATTGSWILELRVDVDRTRPMQRVSGDFFHVSGATTSYFGSFRVESPTVTFTSTTATIVGTGSYSYSTSYPKVQITIPRTTIFQTPAAATLQFISLANAPGAQYVCAFESRYFRTVQYEQDYEQGVTLFSSYNTGSLTSGGAARNLSVSASYAEAGIEMQMAGTTTSIPTAEAGSNLKWSNSELHAAMVNHFSLWQDIPQWKVWMFGAYAHETGPGLYGIMFDQQGKQRQGCATFHQGIGGSSADKLRLQLYTYVHELGHCFNLLHSWQKSYAVPAVPNRPSALSWMNYPWNFPGGATAFWNAFPFQFDDQEVLHLRHAYRDAVIMGGNNFASGSALESLVNPQAFAEPLIDNSGLKLELESPKNFALGEPVVLDIKLSSTDSRGKSVNAHLHPNMGLVQIGIRKPGGQVVIYEPLIEHCVASEMVKLDEAQPAIYESAYIGFGKDGFYFDQPGSYQVRASYMAMDGSEIISNILSLRVSSPHNKADEDVADLFFGDDQGSLLYLLGSDSDSLQSGNDAFDLVIDKHGKHPLAVYARLVKGINAGRGFKSITADKKMVVRETQTEQSVKLLSSVVDSSEAGNGVDNITLNRTMRALAKVHKKAGKDKAAKETMDRMVSIFTKKGLKPRVLQTIQADAIAALEE
ncbi:MAG: hypothetical protein GJV46_16030 [Geobacter sp.]|nr:hypothetical protein [Geobacter sp.]